MKTNPAFAQGDIVEYVNQPGWGQFLVQDVEQDSVEGIVFYRLHVSGERNGNQMTFLEENAVMVKKSDRMQPHQERVIAERARVDGDTERLHAFTGTETMRSLDLAEQHRLVRQLNLMRQLRTVLDERIAAFTPT